MDAPPPHAWPSLHRPDEVALRFEGRAVPYGDLARAVRRAAAALAARGVGRGDRVAFLGANHPAQLVALFALMRLGAAQVPLNWRLAPPELAALLADCAPRLLLATPEWLDAARALGAPCEAADATTALDADGGAATEAAGAPGDDALVVYTSGTTGRPKGAALTQAALAANAANAVATFALDERDHVLTVLPLFHVGGLNIQTLPALSVGAAVTLHGRFDAAAWFDAVERERPTLSLLVPAVMRALVSHPRWPRADLASLRAVGAGSSDVPPDLIAAFHARGVPVQQVYGCTETAPVAVAQTRGEALAAPGSLGRPAPLCEVRVVDPATGAPLAAGATGEIVVRGPNVMRGYLGDEDGATRDAFLPGTGWFRTGDAGRVDAAGRFWFADRLKHLIVSGGENVAPAEVERVLAGAPGVAEGAVCAAPDPRWGEVPVAVVVPSDPAAFDAARVLAHFEGRLARYKHPRRVVVVGALPRTALGKVEVAALRALVAAAETARESARVS